LKTSLNFVNTAGITKAQVRVFVVCNVVHTVDTESLLLQVTPGAEEDVLPLHPVDEQKLVKREGEAVDHFQQQMRQIGKDVTPEAQQTFDFLHKTMPCHWDGKNIIVLDQVKIAPPYQDANIEKIGGEESQLVRIKKVLAGERDRLESHYEKLDVKAAKGGAGTK
jgi:hypothetical protein